MADRTALFLAVIGFIQVASACRPESSADHGAEPGASDLPALLADDLAIEAPKLAVRGEVISKIRRPAAWPAVLIDNTGELLDVYETRILVDDVIGGEKDRFMPSSTLTLFDLAEQCGRTARSTTAIPCEHESDAIGSSIGDQVVVLAGLRPSDVDHPSAGLPFTIVAFRARGTRFQLARPRPVDDHLGRVAEEALVTALRTACSPTTEAAGRGSL